MGDAGNADLPHASQISTAAFAAFPSPASISSALSTPLLERAPKLHSPSAAGETPRGGLLETAGVIPAVPDSIHFTHVQTPPARDIPQPTLNMIVGGALAPTHETPLLPSSTSKPRPGLRLPSFDMLGIAVPHPDRFGIDSNAFESIELEQSTLARAMASLDKIQTPGLPLQSPHLVRGPLTPPEDVPYIDWPNAIAVQQASVSSDINPSETAVQGDSAQDVAPDRASGPTLSHPAGRSVPQQPLMWFEGALQAIVGNVTSASQPTDSLRVLSHALPSPSPNGHVYSSIISAIQQETTAVESWINVFHAIPGRFNLADLPRSPPSTPGPAIGGHDYFTEKVFDSAVSIADYQEDLLQLPRSPRSVVPPGSVDVSIVERYIPPSSSNEFATMFDLTGQSILVDRLRELSRNNGSLLLIYPTRNGGATFMKEYLSPILDPVLRSMVVVHGLSSSLANSLGTMASVEQLPSHATFRRKLETLLTTIAQGGPAVERIFEQRKTPELILSHCSNQFVMLDRVTWAQNWWTKQEKPRVREVVTRYARQAQTRSSNAHIERPRTSTELLQEVLKGVAEKTYTPGQEPNDIHPESIFIQIAESSRPHLRPSQFRG